MKTIKHIRLLLFPIALLYGWLVRARNCMFNIGILKSERFPVPIISVGNITVGGTGKTPLTEFIINVLKGDYKVALLSRGYKRTTKGLVLANAQSTASEIGDEPKQILDKFADITVAVSEKRVHGVNGLLALDAAPDVIVMDDAYQHRYVQPGLSILVVDYKRPLWKDIMLPAGELREPMKGKKRAEIILFSKCPRQLSEAKQLELTRKIKPLPHQQVYFSTVTYQKPRMLFNGQQNAKKICLSDASALVVTGIANPAPFEKHIATLTSHMQSICFPDHYQFTQKDVELISKRFDELDGKNKFIVTTEKDAVRFKQVLSPCTPIARFIYFIPIQIEILNNKQAEFTDKIISYVKQNKRNS
ncbi:lipid-A-disaccharide kinase [Saccharicrinis carchari]|uniref:Tetraacyldisaccharide 4'-kinase n=1 Tax=Saccharicrinis carchari TaxID=1168039 RepID=A0A521BUP0_SACCC|nr:tetraacyldisaccharide 4'-kinase [Saccharicrinis carchari]SMO50879.1 lipid-A-disaccharide kinase [Saccharicrinis carchari]